MSGEMVERVARAIEIAFVEKTLHHPVSREMAKLGWLWPIVARAAIDEMRIDNPLSSVLQAGQCTTGHWNRMIDAALDSPP